MEKANVVSPNKISNKEVVKQLRKLRFYSPNLHMPDEITLARASCKALKEKIDLSFEKSLQFSPIRYVKSPEFRVPDKKVSRAGIGMTSQQKPCVSQLKLTKNQSQRVLSPRKPANFLKFLSNKQLTTRKSPKSIKSYLDDWMVWRKVINTSNGIDPTQGFLPVYSVFIGRGNNSSLVKKTILKRTWWTLTENKDQANFVWTQWKDKSFLATLPSLITKKHELQDFSENFTKDLPLGLKLIVNSPSYCQLKPEKLVPESQKMHNKIEFNNFISNKKSLYLTLKDFYASSGTDIFSKVPLTFEISRNTSDPELQKFSDKFEEFERYKVLHPKFQNIWIVKPGEFTNRGQGITVCRTYEEVFKLVKSSEHPLIVQKYIESPLLISRRKFDIRCYSLMTCINGVMQGYFYLDGYLRTSSQEFSMKDVGNLFVHLTNDAIQKNSREYGKFENGNKMSYRDFQMYLERTYPEKKPNFCNEVLPVIKSVVKDTMLASCDKLDVLKRGNCMEIFGYDFMVDRAFKPWLIEVNTNPCLELSSQYLSILIPKMLDNAFHITLDSLFPPPAGEYTELAFENRFELIFHELVDKPK